MLCIVNVYPQGVRNQMLKAAILNFFFGVDLIGYGITLFRQIFLLGFESFLENTKTSPASRLMSDIVTFLSTVIRDCNDPHFVDISSITSTVQSIIFCQDLTHVQFRLKCDPAIPADATMQLCNSNPILNNIKLKTIES